MTPTLSFSLAITVERFSGQGDSLFIRVLKNSLPLDQVFPFLVRGSFTTFYMVELVVLFPEAVAPPQALFLYKSDQPDSISFFAVFRSLKEQPRFPLFCAATFRCLVTLDLPIGPQLIFAQ